MHEGLWKDRIFFLIIHETAKNPLCVLPSSVAAGRFSRSLTYSASAISAMLFEIVAILMESFEFFSRYFFSGIAVSIFCFTECIGSCNTNEKEVRNGKLIIYLCHFLSFDDLAALLNWTHVIIFCGYINS